MKYRPYRSARRKRRGEKIQRTVMLLLFGLLTVLILANILQSAARKTDRTADASRIIALECKKAVAVGGDREKLPALSRILIRQLGKPYEYGGYGPNVFDCSGLIQYVYAQIGIALPRVVHEQAAAGSPVQKGKLKFGDIIFFSGDGKALTHAGIYVGGGYFVHAPATGETVTLSSLDSKFYSQIYKSAVRVMK